LLLRGLLVLIKGKGKGKKGMIIKG